jgi:hypothetical protein
MVGERSCAPPATSAFPTEAHRSSAWLQPRTRREGRAPLIGLETGRPRRPLPAMLGPSTTGRGSKMRDWGRPAGRRPVSLWCPYVQGQETSLLLNGTIDHARPRKPHLSLLLDLDALWSASNRPGQRHPLVKSPMSWSPIPLAFGEVFTARAGLTDLRRASGPGRARSKAQGRDLRRPDEREHVT